MICGLRPGCQVRRRGARVLNSSWGATGALRTLDGEAARYGVEGGRRGHGRPQLFFVWRVTSLFITPLPGYTPTIGRLVGMLTYTRHTLLAAVEGLSRDELDYLRDAPSNSIGALLAHAAAVERWYEVLTFDARRPSASEEAA